MSSLALTENDALIAVDVQNDFIIGSLAVPGGADVVPALNRYLALFAQSRLPVFATRDWHPPDHCSFRPRGPWPPHCVVNSPGAQFAPGLALPAHTIVVSKADAGDAYSSFQCTGLDERLRRLGVRRLLVGGLATDYCVCHTVLDARRLGYSVLLLTDAIRAVDVTPGDGRKAEKAMCDAGAIPIVFEDLALAGIARGAD